MVIFYILCGFTFDKMNKIEIVPFFIPKLILHKDITHMWIILWFCLIAFLNGDCFINKHDFCHVT